MKHLQRICVFLLLVALILPVFAGCNPDTPGSDETTAIPSQDTTTGETESETEPETEGETGPNVSDELVLPATELANYQIIYPVGASTSLLAKVTQLVEALQTKYACSLNVYTDVITDTVTESEYEILIGDCNRSLCSFNQKEFKYNDYGYRMVDKKLLIAGYEDEQVIAAIDAFIANILNGEQAGDTVFDNTRKLHNKGTYTLDDIRLNDTNIADFRIVYPASTPALLDSAQLIADVVRNGTGYVLEVVDDSAAADEQIPEILIGKTNRDTSSINMADLKENEFQIAPIGTSVWLGGNELIQTVRAVREFSKLLEVVEGDQGIKEVAIESMRLTFDGGKIRTMSFNIKVGMTPGDPRANLVCQVIRTYQPDSVGFQEVEPVVIGILRSKLRDLYGEVGTTVLEGHVAHVNPIFYLKDKYEVIKSGTEWLSDTPTVPGTKVDEAKYCRVYTYAYLKNKTTEEVYVHINTHFDHQQKQARIKQAVILGKFLAKVYEEDIKFIVTGDFNCKPNTDPYNTLMSIGFIRNARDITAEGDITKPTYQAFGDARSLIDHIFLSPYLFVEYYKVCDELIDGEYPSDHNAVFVDWY